MYVCTHGAGSAAVQPHSHHVCYEKEIEVNTPLSVAARRCPAAALIAAAAVAAVAAAAAAAAAHLLARVRPNKENPGCCDLQRAVNTINHIE